MSKLWIERVNLPTKEGFYWARMNGYNWWNLIVKVYGYSPFFAIDVWRYNDHTFVENAVVYDIEEFGPMIAAEAPKMEGVGFARPDGS